MTFSLDYFPCRSEYKVPSKAHGSDTGYDIYSSFADLDEDAFIDENPDLEMDNIMFDWHDDGKVSIHAIELHPGCRVKIPTGIKFKLPQEVFYSKAFSVDFPTTKDRDAVSFGFPFRWGLQVRSKSGLFYKQGLQVGNQPGTIDNGFLGEIQVLLLNTSTTDVAQIKHLQKVAQLVPEQVFDLGEVANTEEEFISSTTDRGADGFGSTGLG